MKFLNLHKAIQLQSIHKEIPISLSLYMYICIYTHILSSSITYKQLLMRCNLCHTPWTLVLQNPCVYIYTQIGVCIYIYISYMNICVVLNHSALNWYLFCKPTNGDLLFPLPSCTQTHIYVHIYMRRWYTALIVNMILSFPTHGYMIHT